MVVERELIDCFNYFTVAIFCLFRLHTFFHFICSRFFFTCFECYTNNQIVKRLFDQKLQQQLFTKSYLNRFSLEMMWTLFVFILFYLIFQYIVASAPPSDQCSSFWSDNADNTCVGGVYAKQKTSKAIERKET